MNPIIPADTNLRLAPPTGQEDKVNTLHAVATTAWGQNCIATLWQPEEKELLGLLSGLPVILLIMGESHPPVYVGVCTEPDRVTNPTEQTDAKR
jgi:hypothetical protein